MIIRNCFVREEGDGLVIGSGLRPEWWLGAPAALGPVLTPFGPVSVQLTGTAGGVAVRVEGEWRGTAPRLQIGVPGFAPVESIPTGTVTTFQLTSLV